MDDGAEQDSISSPPDYKLRAQERSRIGFDKVHEEFGKLWSRIFDKNGPASPKASLRERFRQRSGRRSSSASTSSSRFVSHIGEFEDPETSRANQREDAAVNKETVQPKAKLSKEDSYDDVDFLPIADCYGRGRAGAGKKASPFNRDTSQSLPLTGSTLRDNDKRSRQPSLKTDKNGWPIPGPCSFKAQSDSPGNEASVRIIDGLELEDSDSEEPQTQLADYVNTRDLLGKPEQVDQVLEDQYVDVDEVLNGIPDDEVFEQSSEIDGLDGYMKISEAGNKAKKGSETPVSESSNQTANRQATPQRGQQPSQRNNHNNKVSRDNSPKPCMKRVESGKPVKLPRTDDDRQKKVSVKPRFRVPQNVNASNSTGAVLATNVRDGSGQATVRHSPNELSEATLEQRQRFYQLTVEEVVDCLSACALSGLAAICKEEILDGEYFRHIEKSALKGDPFNLTLFQVDKLYRIIDGWRPKHSVSQ